jgi:hypothetical protein
MIEHPRAQQTGLVDQRLVQVGHVDRLVRVVEEHAAEVCDREAEHDMPPVDFCV